MLNKLFNALNKTRNKFTYTFNNLLNKGINEDVLEHLEEQLLETDMGFDTVENVINVIKKNNSNDIILDVKNYLYTILQMKQQVVEGSIPKIIMLIGINGAGKTTSAAKIAYKYKESGKKVLLIACDTYRAAAVEQLKVWSERINCKIIYNNNTSEPSSVLFDGLQSASSNNFDIVIVDTAGRLHTSDNLMLELKKMYTLIEKRFTEFNVNTLISLDAGLGQNSLVQAKEFNKYCKIDGAVLTKLDGTAKGGILFPLFIETGIPIKYIGTGETLNDLEAFDPTIYIDSLLGVINEEDS